MAETTQIPFVDDFLNIARQGSDIYTAVREAGNPPPQTDIIKPETDTKGEIVEHAPDTQTEMHTTAKVKVGGVEMSETVLIVGVVAAGLALAYIVTRSPRSGNRRGGRPRKAAA